jgi:hypothetical protein
MCSPLIVHPCFFRSSFIPCRTLSLPLASWCAPPPRIKELERSSRFSGGHQKRTEPRVKGERTTGLNVAKTRLSSPAELFHFLSLPGVRPLPGFGHFSRLAPSMRACSYRHRRGEICEGIEPKGGICEMELEGPGKRCASLFLPLVFHPLPNSFTSSRFLVCAPSPDSDIYQKRTEPRVKGERTTGLNVAKTRGAQETMCYMLGGMRAIDSMCFPSPSPLIVHPCFFRSSFIPCRTLSLGICEMELEGPGKRTGLGGMRCV